MIKVALMNIFISTMDQMSICNMKGIWLFKSFKVSDATKPPASNSLEAYWAFDCLYSLFWIISLSVRPQCLSLLVIIILRYSKQLCLYFWWKWFSCPAESPVNKLGCRSWTIFKFILTVYILTHEYHSAQPSHLVITEKKMFLFKERKRERKRRLWTHLL